MRFGIVFILSLVMISSCASDNNYKVESTGNPYEVFVIATQDQQHGILGDTLRSVFGRFVPMLNQEESRLDVKFVTKASMSQLISKHRNLILIRISDTIKKSNISADFDIKSSPQILMYMDSPSQDSLAAYISANGEKILTIFEEQELLRFKNRILNHPAKDVNKRIEEMFGFSVVVPKGYVLRNKVGDNFMWISYETPRTSQGVVIYTYPYDSSTKFNAAEVESMRNSFVSNIPGPLDGSYMTTSTEMTPEIIVVKMGGREWIEMRGLWDVKGDFMGGPFVSYSTIDKPNNRVVVFDFYVYSPKFDKRNYLKQLEAIIQTVNFKQ